MVTLASQWLHGDCRQLLANLPDESIDLTVADPPYNVMKSHNLTFFSRTDIVQKADFDTVFETLDEY